MDSMYHPVCGLGLWLVQINQLIYLDLELVFQRLSVNRSWAEDVNSYRQVRGSRNFASFEEGEAYRRFGFILLLI